MRWSVLSALVLLGCGSGRAPTVLGPTPSGASGDAGAAAWQPGATPPADCVTAEQLKAWQAEIDQQGGGYRPTGSAAHEQYIQLLAGELAAVGLSDVHTEPYVFERWAPSAYSLALPSGPVTVSAHVPYSGTTGPLGVEAPLAYVPGATIPVAPGALAGALQDPAKWTHDLAAAIEASLAAGSGSLAGRIVVFELPRLALSLATITGTTIAVNDPDGTISMSATIARDDLSAMLVMPAMLTALASAGAVAAVGVLDAPEEAARGEYAPFFGTLSPNVPALYVDRDVGAALRGEVPRVAKLVLDATASSAASENLVAVLPGASREEILLGSHTDGPNAIEDNGPAAILAVAKCLAALPTDARPRTIRVVLSGGHFAGSRGLQTYVADHAADLAANALAVMELEHLGAREWTELGPGAMGLTGRAETQVIYTSTNAPLVAASKAFAAEFPRTVVGTPPVLGEGQNFRVVPLVQFITMPEYLLLAGLPVTEDFTDFGLMQRQVRAFVAMEQALALAPASELGVH
jgi:hypothetical protein